MSFIQFENVGREYIVGDHVIKAVDDVSFTIDKGAFTVILGSGIEKCRVKFWEVLIDEI